MFSTNQVINTTTPVSVTPPTTPQSPKVPITSSMSLSPAKMDNTTSGEILSFLQTFKESMEKKMVETKVEIEATNRKLDGRLNNIEEEVRKVNDKIVSSDEISNRMDARLLYLPWRMK